MAKRNIKLKWTLLITYIVIGVFPLIVLSQLTLNTVQRYFVEERKKELLLQANVVSGHIGISDYMYDESKALIFDYDINQTSKQSGYRIMVLDRSGIVVNDSNKTEEGKTYFLPEIVDALNNKDVASVQENGTIHAAVSIVDDRSNCIGVVMVCDSITDIAENVDGIKKQVVSIIMILLVIVCIVIVFLSWLFTNPLNNTIEVIKKMAEGHFDQRIPVNDILHTELAELAESCNNMAEKLDQVETSRQEFVSNVSHELKTPLSSMKVLSDSVLLQNPDTVPKEMYVEFLQDINSEVDRMTAIINDLLTLVRMNRQEVPLNPKLLNITDMAEDVIKRLSPVAEAENIEIVYNKVKNVTAEVDGMKLSLAITNLIENGIKYNSENGKVTVTVDADHQNAFITVSDTGIGIAEEELNKIFERFYRVDKNRDRETGGTGLGLAITKSAILMHNGAIKVSSKENEGTTFVVRIPLKQK
ncbi:MAG: HAMP domain-containing sensor histidine kinase [Candidatus Metalachnospira sp.]|nr:HAMP domain-containing sensor histidine kinase [Candidatus Metalachnospira sp.]